LVIAEEEYRCKYERTKPIKVTEEWINVSTTHPVRKDSPKHIINGFENPQGQNAKGRDTGCECPGSGIVSIVVQSILVVQMVVMWALWDPVCSSPLLAFEPNPDLHPSPTR
jgi:hypothetical protein